MSNFIDLKNLPPMNDAELEAIIYKMEKSNSSKIYER